MGADSSTSALPDTKRFMTRKEFEAFIESVAAGLPGFWQEAVALHPALRPVAPVGAKVLRALANHIELHPEIAARWARRLAEACERL